VNRHRKRVRRSRLTFAGGLASIALVLSAVSGAQAASDDGTEATAKALQDAGILRSASDSLSRQPQSTEVTTSAITGHQLTVAGSTGKTSGISLPTANLGSATRTSSTDIYGSTDASHNFAFNDTPSAGPSALVVLHDPSAPTDYSFEITADGLPARLSAGPNGYIVVETSDGEYVNAIAPAWATDANGSPVETTYSIDGSTLIQSINTEDAAFPVVADPQYACDGISCTLEFNRSETLTFKETGWGGSAAATAACALGGPGFAVACGALGAVVTITATQAYNQGDCLGIRNTGPSPVYPVIYSRAESANCR